MEDVSAFSPYWKRNDAFSKATRGREGKKNGVQEGRERGHTEWTIVAGHFAGRTAALVGHATYPADVAFAVVGVVLVGAGVPAPLGDGVPAFDDDFHRILGLGRVAIADG